MLRKVLGTVLLLGALAGCSGPAGTSTCKVDADCGEGTGLCDMERGLCFAANGDAGDEPEVDPTLCEPRCAPYEACTASRICLPRYTALTVTPGNGSVLDGGVVPVTAELVLGAKYEAIFPESLNFNVVRNDGGTVEALTQLSRNAGVYTTQWTPPGEGVFLLTAAYPEDGGPSTTVQLTVDKTPPTFVVTVPTADAGVSDGGTTYGDPSLANAWRRDQVVPVEIRTNEPNLDLTSLTVALKGTDGGIAPSVGVTPLTGACDAGFCGVAQLKLWEPAFDAFRGPMPVVVQGRDRAGNVGSTSSTSVNVTRWKWVFDAQSGVIKATPAIGQEGFIYLGTTTGTDGKVFALSPDGPKHWEVQLGAVEGSPAVGANDAGTELVYVGAKTSNGVSLYALRGENGGTRLKCPGSGATDTFGTGSLGGAIAVGFTTGELVETAVSVFNGASSSAIIGIKPEASFAQCPSVVSPGGSAEKIPAIIAGSSVAMRDENIFYPGVGLTSPKVISYVFGSNSPRTNWPINLSIVPRNLALVGTSVIGVGGSIDPPVSGGLFAAPQDGATDVSRLYPEASWTSRVFNFSVGRNSVVFFGAEPSTGDIQFNRLDTNTTPSSLLTASSTSPIRAAPVIGRDGYVYTATVDGLVGAWGAEGVSPRWVLSMSLGTVEASPTLDCPRDATGAFVEGNHGVLYVPAGGKLYAFVVDSRGLDPSAPWPKFQHDARNTGNPATPITSCP